MLEQVRFSFVVRLLSETHIGDGEMLTLEDLRGASAKSSDKKELVATIQRGENGAPIIEAASLRGALKAHLTAMGYGTEATDLFGLDEIDEGNYGPHILRLHAGELETGPTEGHWPLFRPLTQAENFSGTFIATGIALDRHAKTVRDKLLYRHEMLPPGSRFKFTGTFLGGKDLFHERMTILFDSMCIDRGFSIGAGGGYGWGRVRLDPESVRVTLLCYDASNYRVQTEVLPWVSAGNLSPSADPAFILELHCKGPFLIHDPHSPVSGSEERDSHLSALKGADDTPVLTGKAVVQALRQRSEWLEWDPSGKNLEDRHFRPGDRAEVLTRSQRLFGVAGWAKRVQVDHVDVEWQRDLLTAQGIKLDAFTQAPVDGALFKYKVPANVSVLIRLRIRDHGLFDGDIAHFDRLMEDLRQPENRLRLGHSTSTGFGAFEVRQAAREVGDDTVA